jgi:uncharacterized protein YeeX (DUF496 family)
VFTFLDASIVIELILILDMSPHSLKFEKDFFSNFDESEDLEKDLTINEIKKIIFSMKQYKSPGLDGIINEFYQIYWDTIKEDLSELLLEIFDKFEISASRPLIFCHSLFCPFFLSTLKKYLVDCSPFSYQSTLALNLCCVSFIFIMWELVTHMDKKLTCDESEDLEKDLTINETKKIIFSMKQYKSPGLDGIMFFTDQY